MTLDWSQILIGLATLGSALGAALGQRLTGKLSRRVIDNVWREKEQALVKRIEALEKAQGWSQRK